MDNKQFVDFAERILALEEEKKGIGEEIKESIEAFSENTGITKKGVAKAIKEFKEWKRNESEWAVISREVDQIMNDVAFKEI